MDKKWHGQKIIEVSSLDQLRTLSLEGINLVRVPGKQSGGIYTPESMSWLGALPQGRLPWSLIRSEETRVMAPKLMKKMIDLGYEVSSDLLNEKKYEDFKVLYEKEVMTKEHFIGVNLFDQSYGKVLAGFKTVLLGVYLQSRLVAGLVGYFKRGDFYVTVGAKERVKGIKGGLGGVLELQLLELCEREGIETIHHGNSVNPVGLATKIGLFEFKARYGYSAFPAGRWCTLFWLRPPIDGEHIYLTLFNDTFGYLLVSPQDKTNVSSLYSTNEIAQVSNKLWDEVVKNSMSVLENYVSVTI